MELKLVMKLINDYFHVKPLLWMLLSTTQGHNERRGSGAGSADEAAADWEAEEGPRHGLHAGRQVAVLGHH